MWFFVISLCRNRRIWCRVICESCVIFDCERLILKVVLSWVMKLVNVREFNLVFIKFWVLLRLVVVSEGFVFWVKVMRWLMCLVGLWVWCCRVWFMSCVNVWLLCFFVIVRGIFEIDIKCRFDFSGIVLCSRFIFLIESGLFWVIVVIKFFGIKILCG